MAHYQIKITVSATRLPDPLPEPAPYDPGKDPTHEIVTVLREQMAAARMPPPSYGMYRDSGMTFAKEVEISAESFHELAAILGKFDALSEEIDFANSVKR